MKIEKAELAAYILIIVGLVLLVFTFLMAYILLTSDFGMILHQIDLSRALSEILGPIAAAIIRVLYLGVMGWAGSIATIRGIQLYKEIKRAPIPKTENEKKSD